MKYNLQEGNWVDSVNILEYSYCDYCTYEPPDDDYYHDKMCETPRDVEYGYHINENKMNYNSAVNYCKNVNMSLVTINNDLINKRVNDIAVEHNIGPYWINGNDNAKEGNWVDSENNSLLYKNWKRNEPNGGRSENCIHGMFNETSEWNDYPCDLCNVAICEPKTENVEYGYHINPHKMEYNCAFIYCKKLNMLLVTIKNSLINKRVYDIAVKYNIGSYWINGNDNAKEGNWVDSENNPLLYKNWKRNEPNGDNSENCIQGLFNGKSEWNDYPCNHDNSVICERIPQKDPEICNNIKYYYYYLCFNSKLTKICKKNCESAKKVETPEFEKLPVPTRIRIERKSGTEIHISWELPVLMEKNRACTIIEGFIILYSPIEFSPKWLKQISQKSSLSANIKGLKENVTYQFKVAATNYVGDNGTFSESVEENKRLPNSTSIVVQSLRCRVQDIKSLKVEWKAPSFLKDLILFEIHYSTNLSYITDKAFEKSEFINTKSKFFLRYIKNVNHYYVMLDKLHSNVMYKISVRTIYHIKDQYDSHIEIICATSSNVPDIVEAPIIVGLDKDKQQVMVKLHRCSQRNGKISNYFIIVGNMKTINKKQYSMQDPNLYTFKELIDHTKSNNAHGVYIAIRKDTNRIFQENGRNYSNIFLGDGANEENHLIVNKKLKRHVYYVCFVRVCLQDSNNSLCKSSPWSHPFMIDDMIDNINNSYINNQSLTSNTPAISNWILIMIFLVSGVILAVASIIVGFILKLKKSKEITMIFSNHDDLDLQFQ